MICLAAVWLCLRIPAWVEVTEGEVPTTLLPIARAGAAKPRRAPMSRDVVTALWANGTIRSLTGFLMLFAAFVVKNETEGAPGDQLILLGVVGAAAGRGRLPRQRVGARGSASTGPTGADRSCASCSPWPAVVVAAVGHRARHRRRRRARRRDDERAAQGLPRRASSSATCPRRAAASAFGRSETILQLSWVFGGALGVLLPPTWWIGFTVIAVVVALGTVQTVLISRGSSIPAAAGRRTGSGRVAGRPGEGGEGALPSHPGADRGWRCWSSSRSSSSSSCARPPGRPPPATSSSARAGRRVEVGASQFCDVQVTECGADPEAAGVLRVPPNTPLAVTVPEEVASTPWQVAFTFRDAAGAVQQGRSPVFAPGTTPTFTLVLPAATDQLESAEVQQYGARISQGPNGLEFATRATWVLSVDDR